MRAEFQVAVVLVFAVVPSNELSQQCSFSVPGKKKLSIGLNHQRTS